MVHLNPHGRHRPYRAIQNLSWRLTEALRVGTVRDGLLTFLGKPCDARRWKRETRLMSELSSLCKETVALRVRTFRKIVELTASTNETWAKEPRMTLAYDGHLSCAHVGSSLVARSGLSLYFHIDEWHPWLNVVVWVAYVFVCDLCVLQTESYRCVKRRWYCVMWRFNVVVNTVQGF